MSTNRPKPRPSAQFPIPQLNAEQANRAAYTAQVTYQQNVEREIREEIERIIRFYAERGSFDCEVDLTPRQVIPAKRMICELRSRGYRVQFFRKVWLLRDKPYLKICW